MALKRKRSVDDSPMSLSSFAASTPQAQSPTPMPNSYNGTMDMDMSPRFVFNHSWEQRKAGWRGSDWGNRTRKRVRDNRPDERVIHENTMHKLFDAQRKHPHAEPIMSEPQLAPSQQPHSTSIQKSTLHSFWKIPAPAVQPPSIHITQHQVSQQAWNAPRCEDCDAPLHSEADGMDIDMELDGRVEGNQFACNDCGRNVCGTCAVVGNTRHCLQCATAERRSGRWW